MAIIRSILVLGLGLGFAFQSASARPQCGCSGPTTTTHTAIRPVCLIACAAPTSTCAAGEPTGPAQPTPATVTLTDDANPCTTTVQVIPHGGCGLCPSCTTTAGPEATGPEASVLPAITAAAASPLL